jgi:hypothetical protein
MITIERVLNKRKDLRFLSSWVMIASGKFVGIVPQKEMGHLAIGPMPLLLEAAYSNPLEEEVVHPILRQ